MFYENIAEKKYICWSLDDFIEEMKIFHKNRTLAFIMKLGVCNVERQFLQGLPPLNIEEAIKDIHEKRGEIYELFREHNAVGGDTFIQEIHTALSFADLLESETILFIGLPVKKTCPKGVRLHFEETMPYRESNSEYDFVIKTKKQLVKYQLKSAPEKHIQEFDPQYFIEDIIKQSKKYNDPEMTLAYLLQPSIERFDEHNFFAMFNDISDNIKEVLPLKDVFFVARSTLETYDYIQVFPILKRWQINIDKSLVKQVKKTL